MKLTTISASNFKGQTFTLPLADCQLLVGRNFAGKTARTDAIRLLLLGYLPELGKTARATFGLASGPEMTVSGAFDDGTTIRRRYFLKGDTVKVELEMDGPSSAGYANTEQNLGKLAVMLNADEYFSKGDRERINYVFANAKLPAEYTIESIKTRLCEKGMETVANELDMDLPNYDDNARTYVDAMILRAAAKAKSAKDHAARMQQTIQGLTAMREDDVTAGPSLSSLETTRAQLERKKTEINESRIPTMARYTAIVSGRQRRLQIESEINLSGKNRQNLVVLQDKLRLAREALMATTKPNPAELATVAYALNTIQNEGNDCLRRIAECEKKEADLQKQLNKLSEKKNCPFCGATGENWKVLRTSQIDEELQASQLERNAATLQAADARMRYADLAKSRKTLVDAINEYALLEVTENTVTRQVASLEPAIARVTALHEELERIPKEDADLQKIVEEVQGKLNDVDQDIRATEAAIKVHNGRQHELQRLASAEQERDKAKQEQEQASACEKELRLIQKEMVAAAFGPLLRTANSIFPAILKSPLAYHEGEIGTWRDGLWVGHHTFSGTEKSLTYAAIQAALASESPVRVMIIDELGRLDAENANVLTAAAIEAIRARTIDQFIGIDTGKANYYRDTIPADCAFNVAEIG